MPKNPIKILYTADWHLRDTIPACRLDDFKEAQFKKLEEVSAIIKSEKPDFWINGGDLFDVYNPSYELVNRFTEFLIDLPAGVHMYSVAGNHDMMAYNADLLKKTALGNLIVNGHITLLTEASMIHSDGKQLYIKGISARKQPKYSDYEMPEVKATSIIVTHDPIVETPVVFDHMLIKDVAKSTGADVVLCSHIHAQFDVTAEGTRFINPGPIFRQTVEEMDVEPTICMLEI